MSIQADSITWFDSIWKKQLQRNTFPETNIFKTKALDG